MGGLLSLWRRGSKLGRMKHSWMCLWLAAALLLLTSDVNALPIPEGGDIVVSRAEVRKLEHLETRLASTAKSLRKGLQEASQTWLSTSVIPTVCWVLNVRRTGGARRHCSRSS